MYTGNLKINHMGYSISLSYDHIGINDLLWALCHSVTSAHTLYVCTPLLSKAF